MLSQAPRDDTPIALLALGNGKTVTGRHPIYVRCDRSAREDTAPVVRFANSEDRKGEHPQLQLKTFEDTLEFLY